MNLSRQISRRRQATVAIQDGSSAFFLIQVDEKMRAISEL